MARTPLDDETSEQVGYRRPPTRHRIRDGETRNPWGRRGKPKAPVEFLDEQISLKIDGEPRRLSRREALDYFLFAKAAKGDVRAIRLIEDRARQRQSAPLEQPDSTLSAEDQAAFDRFVRRAARRLDQGEPQ